MTNEIGSVPPAPPSMSAEQAAVVRQLLVDAARSGAGGAPLLRALLKDVKLPPDQQMLVDMLLESATTAETKPAPAAAPAAAGAAEVHEVHDEVAELRQELADLRQANDTMAAALGACPYCWGGYRSCQVCRGHGSPGYAPPDLELFEELVVPALRRAREQQQRQQRRDGGGSRGGGSRLARTRADRAPNHS